MIDPTALTDRLTDIAQSDPDVEFLADEQAVSDWLASQPLDDFAASAHEQITARTVGLDEDVNGHTLREIIQSHNDDPDAFEAGYVIDAGKTIVQYRHRGASEKPPITSAEVDAALAEHIDDLVRRAVWGEVLPAARDQFLTES